MRLGRLVMRAALIAFLVLMAVTVFAWVQAVRLPDYANYWEWQNGWHIGVRNGGTLYHPVWWDTYIFVGQFPDHGVLPAWQDDGVFRSPYRWPDFRAREIRLAWPLVLSLAITMRLDRVSFSMPAVWPRFPGRHLTAVLLRPGRRRGTMPPMARRLFTLCSALSLLL